jgi:ribonucleoside-diphosphate reductase alpha chain
VAAPKLTFGSDTKDQGGGSTPPPPPSIRDPKKHGFFSNLWAGLESAPRGILDSEEQVRHAVATDITKAHGLSGFVTLPAHLTYQATKYAVTGKKKDKAEALPGDGEKLSVAAAPMQAGLAGEPKPYRRRLPDERRSITHKFQVSGHEGYITVGLYPDGQPGELFLKMAKEGSTVSGLMDSFATTVSVALQYGVPLKDLVNKFAHVRFEPSGFTGNQEIPIAKSIVDYIFRWLGSRFLSPDDKGILGLIDRSAIVEEPPAGSATVSPALDQPIATSPLASSMPAPDSPSPAPAQPSDDAPKATAVAAEPTESAKPAAEPLAVIATNGSLANGHAANGNGAAKASNGGSTAPISLNFGNTKVSFQTQADAPSCAACGSIMVRNGSCYKCLNCGSTSGCS